MLRKWDNIRGRSLGYVWSTPACQHKECQVIIVAFLESATIGYSLESLCVCFCVCVCVFLHDNSKRNRSRNTKLEYIVVYENSSDEFDIELHRIKVKVIVGVQTFCPFTTMQIVRSYSSRLVQARNLIFSKYVHLVKYCASMKLYLVSIYIYIYLCFKSTCYSTAR